MYKRRDLMCWVRVREFRRVVGARMQPYSARVWFDSVERSLLFEVMESASQGQGRLLCAHGAGGGDAISNSSDRWLSADNLRNDSLSRWASTSPTGTTEANVTSQSRIPQLAAISGGTSNTAESVAMVAICDPPPTAGNCSIDPAMLAPIRISSCETGISKAS